MNTKTVAKILNMGDSTVRLYARNYEDFLDAHRGATGRRQRDFTDRDLRVLRYIGERKSMGAGDAEIRASLQAMTDDELPEAPELGAAYVEDEESRQRLAVEVAILRKQIESLQTDLGGERDRRLEAEQKLDKARGELAEKVGRLEALQAENERIEGELAQVGELQERVQTLEREAGRLEGRQPVTFWLVIIGVVFAVAVVLAVAVIWYVGIGR